MAKNANLVLQLSLRGPVNARPVINSLRRQLSGIHTKVSVQLDRTAATRVAFLSKRLDILNDSSVRARTHINALTNSLSSLRSVAVSTGEALRGLSANARSLSTLANSVRRMQGSNNISINVNIGRNTLANIDGVITRLSRLNTILGQTTASANTLSAALTRLSTSFSSINPQVRSISDATKQTDRLAKSTRVARTEIEEFGRVSGLSLRRFAGFTVAAGAVFGFVRAVTSGIGKAISFNKEMVRLSQVTKISLGGLQDISSEITRLATSFGVSSEELIAVSSTLAQAGLTAKDTRVSLEALAKSSLAPSFGDINETTEASIALMRQFGIEAKDLEKALGSINAVSAAFAVESDDIAKGIRIAGGVFASASKGVASGTDALNQFIATLTSVRATTRASAESIATGLNTIVARIQRPGTIEFLKKFGIELTDIEGKFVGPFEALNRLSKGLKNFDTRDTRFAQIVEELGGFRQLRNVIPLIAQLETRMDALRVAQAGQNSLNEDARIAQLSLANQIAKTREEFLSLIRSITDSKSFQVLTQGVLGLTNGLIKLSKAMEPVLPFILLISGIKAVSGLSQFTAGFFGGIRGSGGAKAVGNNLGAVATGTTKAAGSAATLGNTSALSNNTLALKQLTVAIQTYNNRKFNIPYPTGAASPVRRFATGGFVPGSGNRDTELAMLMPGEYVINKKTAKKIGYDNLDNLNFGKVRGFATGGRILKDFANRGASTNVSQKSGVDFPNPFSTKEAAKELRDFVRTVRKSGESVKDTMKGLETYVKSRLKGKPVGDSFQAGQRSISALKVFGGSIGDTPTVRGREAYKALERTRKNPGNVASIIESERAFAARRLEAATEISKVPQINTARTSRFAGIKGGIGKIGATLASKGPQASIAALLLGPLLQNSIGTDTPGAAGTGAAITGALGGAVTGGSLGSMFGPIGTAVGTALGGLIGGITGFKDAFDNTKITKQFDDLSKATSELDNAFNDFVKNNNSSALEASFSNFLNASDAVNSNITGPGKFAGIGRFTLDNLFGGAGNLGISGAAFGSELGGIPGAAVGGAIGTVIGGFNNDFSDASDAFIKGLEKQTNARSSETFARGEAFGNRAKDIVTQQLLSGRNINDINPTLRQGLAFTGEQGLRLAQRETLIRESTTIPEDQKERKIQEARRNAQEINEKLLVEQVNNQINLEAVFKNANKELNSLIQVFSKLTSITGIATAEFNQAGAQLEAFYNTASGNATLGPANRSISNILNNLQGASKEDVSLQLSRLTRLGGGSPVLSSLERSVGESKLLQDELPKIFKTAIESVDLGKAGTADDGVTIRQNIENQVNALNVSDTLKKAVSGFISEKLTGRQKGTTEEDILSSVPDFIKEFGPLSEQAAEAAREFATAFEDSRQAFTDSANKFISIQKNANDAFRRVTSIRIDNELEVARILGRTLSIDESSRGLTAQVTSLAGSTNPNEILARFNGLQSLFNQTQSAADNASLAGNTNEFARLTKVAAGFGIEINQAKEALELLANDTRRAAAIREKLNGLEQRGENAKNLLDAITTGDFASLNRINRGAGAFARFKQTGDLGKTADERQLTIEFARNLAGLLGEEARKKLEKDIVKAQLKFAGNDTGVFQQALGPAATNEGRALIAELQATNQIQEQAAQALATIAQNSADTFGKGIVDQLKRFVDGVFTKLGILEKELQPNVVAEAKARGGVIFRKRGTDTVPAMLTPDEYVVNAKSSKKHRGLLDKINNDTLYMARGGIVDRGFARRMLRQFETREETPGFTQEDKKAVLARRKAEARRLNEERIQEREERRHLSIQMNKVRVRARNERSAQARRDNAARIAQRNNGSLPLQEPAGTIPNLERVRLQQLEAPWDVRQPHPNQNLVNAIRGTNGPAPEVTYLKNDGTPVKKSVAKTKAKNESVNVASTQSVQDLSGLMNSFNTYVNQVNQYVEKLKQIKIPETITLVATIHPVQVVFTGESALATEVARQISQQVESLVDSAMRKHINPITGETNESLGPGNIRNRTNG